MLEYNDNFPLFSFQILEQMHQEIVLKITTQR